MNHSLRNLLFIFDLEVRIPLSEQIVLITVDLRPRLKILFHVSILQL